MLSFLRYKLKYSESNMYMLLEGRQALIIDPNISDEALSELRCSNVKEVYILLTHEHFDHTTGVNWYREKFDTTVVCQKDCAAKIIDSKNNRPFVFFPMVEDRTEEEKREVLSFYDALPTNPIRADVVFDDVFKFDWRKHNIFIKACPGHSPGSAVVIVDNEYAFTGDYMIPDVPVILRFPGGSKELYNKRTLPYLLGLAENMLIMPGHGDPYLKINSKYQNGIFKSGDENGK